MERAVAQTVGVTGRRARWQAGQHLRVQAVTEHHGQSLPCCGWCKSATQKWVQYMPGVPLRTAPSAAVSRSLSTLTEN